VVGLVLLLAALTVATGGAAPTTVGPGAGAASTGLPPAVVAAPVAAAPVASTSGDPLAAHRAEVTQLLGDVAAAFAAGDAALLAAQLHDPTTAFGRAWLARAEAMAEVPLTGYDLALDTSLADLTTPALAADGALLVNVVETHGLLGAEQLGDASEHLYLTLRRSEGAWRVAGDNDAAPLGLLSVRHLWDDGPVVAARRGDVLLLHHPGQPSVAALLDEASAALAVVRERWPLAWPGQLVVLVPEDQDELADLLQVSFGLDAFVAFASGNVSGTLGAFEVTGTRVLLNTSTLLRRSPATRRSVLAHELVHVATRPATGPAVPAWLEEGVAQVVGQRRSQTGTSLLTATPAAELALPADAAFTGGTPDDTRRSYQLSWGFVDWLVRTRGVADLGRFYAAAGDGATRGVGTADARLDAAAVAVYGSDLASLVDGWRRGR
jgi:hypothetical protein